MGRYIILNDVAYADEHLDPLRSLSDVIAFAADDWGESRAKAWVYGIVLGWDDDDDDFDAMREIASRFGWGDEQVGRLRALHERFMRLADDRGEHDD